MTTPHDKPAAAAKASQEKPAAAAVQDQGAYDRMAAEREEYGVWVATEPIYVGTALAYMEGDPVPTSNVKLHGYDKAGVVAKR